MTTSSYHAIWLMIHQFSRFQLDTMTSVHKTGDGELYLKMYTMEETASGEETFIYLDQMIHARIISKTLDEYLNFVQLNGRLVGNAEDRKNPEYAAYGFSDFDILAVIRKRLAQEELNETESLIFQSTHDFWHNAQSFPPLALKEDAVQEPGEVLSQLLDVLSEVSEETGFYYNVRFEQYDFSAKAFIKLDEPWFIITCDCSDFFDYGTADGETMTLENVAVYQSLYKKMEAAAPTDWDETQIAAKTRLLFAMVLRKKVVPAARFTRWSEPIQELFTEVNTVNERRHELN